ncbi:unnamed protein product [Callosobruchus maculatus]|uniref:Uncharacterized protein n=1 Tax=Callosobruchus maculatus TaxID=64391 RepID=A0A653D167_CALMS|nr:unnamed protein product [Callosobruchus maculatus]
MEYSINVNKTPTVQQINQPCETLMKHKESMLLGFKDNQPVYQNKTRMNTKDTVMGNVKDDSPTAAAVNTSKVLDVKVDPKTQEKFIILNGKRFRMATLEDAKSQMSSQNTLKYRDEKTSSPHILSQADNGKLENVDKTQVNKNAKAQSNQNATTFRTQETSLPHTLTPVDNGKLENVDKAPQVNKDKVMNMESVLKNKGNPLADDKQSNDSTIVVIKCKNEKCELANKLKVNSAAEFDKTDTPKMELLASNVIVKDGKILRKKKVLKTVECAVETDITNRHMEMMLKKFIGISFNKEVQTDIQIDPKEKVNENIGCYSPLEELAQFLSPSGLEELLSIPCEIDSIPATSKPDKSNMEKNVFKELHAALIADDKGNMPIHQAVIMNNLTKVKKCACILRALNLPGYIDLPNVDQLTPLSLAIMHGASTDIISFLLSEGAKLNSADSEGNTAFHLTIEFQRKDALEILLSCKGPDFNLNAVNHKGMTPLIMCCMSGKYCCADLLLQHGADPNIKDGNSGRTALFHAVETENEELVKLLMRYGADTKEKNFFGTSPHDAMFEIDVSESMRKLILCKSNRKRGAAEAAALRGTVVPESRLGPQKPPPKPNGPTSAFSTMVDRSKIKTYPSLKKIKKDEFDTYSFLFAK